MPTGAKLLQSCLTLCDPMDCSPPCSSVQEILQARKLEWVVISSAGDLPNPRIKPMSLMSPALQVGSLPLAPPRKLLVGIYCWEECKYTHTHTMEYCAMSSVAQSCLTLCDHMDGIYVHTHEYTQWNSVAAAAAAKSLQSYPTLCDPIDSSPPGSPVPRILQARTLEWVARTLEWVAISFSNAWNWNVKVKSLSRVQLSDPMDCSLPGSSVHGIFQARGLEWGAIASSEWNSTQP